jgi:uncharacterized protein
VRRLCAILILVFGFRLLADEVIPPPPAAYFNDYAHVVSAGTAAKLNQTLEDFERQSSDQIVVAVFPKMQSDSSIEDYTVRVARSWQAGQTNKKTGRYCSFLFRTTRCFCRLATGWKASCQMRFASESLMSKLRRVSKPAISTAA